MVLGRQGQEDLEPCLSNHGKRRRYTTQAYPLTPSGNDGKIVAYFSKKETPKGWNAIDLHMSKIYDYEKIAIRSFLIIQIGPMPTLKTPQCMLMALALAERMAPKLQRPPMHTLIPISSRITATSSPRRPSAQRPWTRQRHASPHHSIPSDHLG